MKTLEQLKEFYESLSSEFEGYIQMSDEKLNKVFTSKQKLPSWDSLHNGKNFIFEACLFDGDRSITIRQVNDKFAVIDKKLSQYQKENITTQSFLTTAYSKANISQIWEEKEDENCLNKLVLKPTIQLFTGFQKAELQGESK
jgi:CRISPR type III-associated protein (TIGR04423 family)